MGNGANHRSLSFYCIFDLLYATCSVRDIREYECFVYFFSHRVISGESKSSPVDVHQPGANHAVLQVDLQGGSPAVHRVSGVADQRCAGGGAGNLKTINKNS